MMENAKGIFRQPSSHGLVFRALNRRKAKQTLDAFAELLAEECSPEEAAVKLGYLPRYGNVLLERLRRKLGRQAQ